MNSLVTFAFGVGATCERSRHPPPLVQGIPTSADSALSLQLALRVKGVVLQSRFICLCLNSAELEGNGSVHFFVPS